MTVAKNRFGGPWPLGFIAVTVPGTPVCINSLVDPSGIFTSTSTTTEYSDAVAKIEFTAPATNAGPIYIVTKGGSKSDTGSILATLTPGSPTYVVPSVPNNMNTLGIEQYYVDADNPNDGAQVTAFVG